MEMITELCTGCRACEQSCPKHAIKMAMDQEGFWFAQINQNLCVNCGLCHKKCPQNKEFEKTNQEKVVFVAQNKDQDSLFKSASGGIFGALAAAYIRDEGVAFGVRYDKAWNAHHAMATNTEELQPLLSSKYVQADTRNSYSEVKQQLLQGKEVLYSGTGCQIAGLKSFLGKNYPNLLTIDIICHGVASPLLFQKYIQWLEKEMKEPVSFFNFRHKSAGWGEDAFVKTATKSKLIGCNVDPYFYNFLKGNSFRESCYHCHYSNSQRTGDITLGDFWGVKKEHPTFNAKVGASVVILNTEKAKEIWSKYADLFTFQNSTFEQAAKYNKNLRVPTERNSVIRDEFYKGICNDAPNWFESFAKRFHPKMKSRIKSLMPLWLRKFIGR